MLRKNVVAIVVVGLVIGLVGACKKKGVLVGSCDRRASDAARNICEDAYDGAILSGCDVAHGSEIPAGKTSTAGCDRASALAGCKFPDSISWYFPSKRVKSVENVAAVCMGTLIGPDAKELTGITKVDLKTDEQMWAEEKVAKWKPDFEAKFAMIEKIAKSVPPPTKKVKGASGYDDTVKLLTLNAADLSNIAVNAEAPHRFSDSLVLAQCIRMVRKNDMTGIEKPTEPLDACHDAKWLAIERTASVQEPAWLGSGSNIDAYKRGHAQGDVLIYDLATGTLLGAAPWDADSSRDLKTTSDNAKKDMATDFEKQIGEGLGSARFQAEGRKLPSSK